MSAGCAFLMSSSDVSAGHAFLSSRLDISAGSIFTSCVDQIEMMSHSSHHVLIRCKCSIYLRIMCCSNRDVEAILRIMC